MSMADTGHKVLVSFTTGGKFSAEQLSAVTDVPLFLGYIHSFLLQGMLIVQVFIYYLTFPCDKRWIKSLVYIVFFVECLSSFFAGYAAVSSLITYGDLLDLEFLWAFNALAPLCGVAALLVHLFYSWRIWIIGQSLILPVIIMILSLAQCVMVSFSGIAFTLGAGLSTVEHPQYLAINVVWLGGSAVCDIIIASTLVTLFNRANSASNHKETKSMLARIMTVTIETGMITAFGAAIELIFFLVFRNSFIHFILFYMLPKLYANCMMATLNSRMMLPGRSFQDSGNCEASSNDSEAALYPETVSGLSETSTTSGLSPNFGVHVIVTKETDRAHTMIHFPHDNKHQGKPLPRAPIAFQEQFPSG